MDSPSEKNKPQRGSEQELNDCYTDTALEKLPKAGNEEAAQRCEHIPARPLSRHSVISTSSRVRLPPNGSGFSCNRQR